MITLEEFAENYQVEVKTKADCHKCVEILKKKFPNVKIGERNGRYLEGHKFFRKDKFNGRFDNLLKQFNLTTISIKQFEEMMKEEKQEFKFGQEGRAWHFQDKEIKPCRFVKVNGGAPLVIFLHDDLVIDAEDFSIEKPERFNVGDIILDTTSPSNENMPRVFTYLGNKKWWNHRTKEEENESDIVYSDKLLYTAEQLDDPNNYTVHWSYLDEIKEAYNRGEVIEIKHWCEDDKGWAIATSLNWSPKFQHRIKPNQKPQIDGFELVEILPDSNGELCVGEHWLSRCLDEPSFAGFVYKEEDILRSESVLYADCNGAKHKVWNASLEIVRPKYVAFIKNN